MIEGMTCRRDCGLNLTEAGDWCLADDRLGGGIDDRFASAFGRMP
jgi:hypothetical protein